MGPVCWLGQPRNCSSALALPAGCGAHGKEIRSQDSLSDEARIADECLRRGPVDAILRELRDGAWYTVQPPPSVVKRPMTREEVREGKKPRPKRMSTDPGLHATSFHLPPFRDSFPAQKQRERLSRRGKQRFRGFRQPSSPTRALLLQLIACFRVRGYGSVELLPPQDRRWHSRP